MKELVLECETRRIEECLRKVASEVKAKFIGKNGAAYRNLAQKEVNVALQMEDLELETLADVDAKLNEQKTLNKDLQKEKEPNGTAQHESQRHK